MAPPETTDATPLPRRAERHQSPRSGLSVVALLAVVLSAIVVSQTLLRRDPPGDPPRREPVAEGVVLLVVDRGDGRPIEHTVEWRRGLTAFDALVSAPMNRPGAVETTGSGKDVFVRSIGGLAGEGPGGRNWIVSVNGERSRVGAGWRLLAKGDRVLWRFAAPE